MANKLGPYLRALAAGDNGGPFFVALPSTTIDWEISDGLGDIPIEQRSADELTRVWGRTRRGELTEVEIAPPGCAVRNDAFDVTPARLVTALVTERGVCAASTAGLRSLFPERSVREGGGVG